MVEWGSVKLPELEYRKRDWGPTKSHPEPGLVHLPTGLRMESVPTRLQNRGEWREYLIHAPSGEDWLLRLSVYGWVGLHGRIEQHLGIDSLLFDLTTEESTKARNEFLREFGQEYVCDEIIPEPGSAMPDWTEEQRDAVVMLLFYILEVLQSTSAGGDPCPSTIKFMKDVSDLFIGTYRNPVRERI